ncbi:hypothetical protein ACFW5D_37785, partial [Streptomyces sp. NPDC058770]|uniref:hypothetical protein n=1 Tax=Streptomyces sp. NPDC058770 TaxID=3346631 RepID=UPI00367B0FE8
MSGKSFEISKWEVQRAWEKVKVLRGRGCGATSAAAGHGCSLDCLPDLPGLTRYRHEKTAADVFRG